MICTKCENKISNLNLSEERRLMLWGMIHQDLKIFAVQYLIDKEKFTHRESKLIVSHFNSKNGECHNCNSTELKGEYINCSKCQAFNYNLKCEPSFNADFCTHLEFSLDFNELEDEKLRGFWCDGVDSIPSNPSTLSKKIIANSKKIKTRSWLGKSGQEVYDMTIEFGEQALEKYLNNESIIDCIPQGNYKDWIYVDPINKQAIVTLK